MLDRPARVVVATRQWLAETAAWICCRQILPDTLGDATRFYRAKCGGGKERRFRRLGDVRGLDEHRRGAWRETQQPVEVVAVAAESVYRASVTGTDPMRRKPAQCREDILPDETGESLGIRGIVLRDESCWRVVVSVEALDRSIAIELDREVLNAWPLTSLEIAR